LNDISTCSGCEGFTGIYDSWAEVRGQILNAVTAAHKTYPSYKVVSTGHSLGAGIATFAAAELRNAGFVTDMAAFASPRVGNPTFAAFMESQAPKLGQNYRVTHKWDPVPDTPFQAEGYVHVLPAYYISSGNNVTVTPADITLQTTEIDPPTAPSVDDADDAHDWYFNRVPACYPSACEYCIPY